MAQKPRVSVITPVFNARDRIEATIKSVLNQTYDDIEYIVIDGASTDGTVELINKYKERLTSFVSEPDSGMYDALTKGFQRATGEIVCYLNAGDFFYPHALNVVVDIFSTGSAEWITGCRSVCNDRAEITQIDLPFRYRSSLIRCGSYDGKMLPFIQQESTFWKASLLKEVNFEVFKRLRLAGDYYLWCSFSKKASLEVVSSPLGVFRRHVGQLSEQLDSYFEEIRGFAERKNLGIRIAELQELILWALHPRLRALFLDTVYRFDYDHNRWVK